MPEAEAMKVETEKERVVLRAILARGEEKWNECPCGWFYKGARCPDKTCKEWKKAHGGSKRVKLYAHSDEETYYERGKNELGLEGQALEHFANWGYELEFEADVDMETGEVKLLYIDGHKIVY